MSSSIYYNLEEQRERRALFFKTTRDNIGQVLNPDGTPKIRNFEAPHREPLWAAAALFEGEQEHIDLINKVIARWHDVPRVEGRERENHGSDFGIFQSNTMTHLYHRFHDLFSPEAKKVALQHVEHATRLYKGSRQPDTKFHGANDNMPMMATQGMIFAGEILGHQDSLRQGIWYLNQVRLLLSRSAWFSEYNSSTYSAVTLSQVAQLATYSETPEVREIALEIEHRLWAEILLHFHPPTFMQAGPQSRAYSVDHAGHTHSLQTILWMVLGEELSGRDPIRSLFMPDGVEVIHFQGCPFQSIAEYVHFLDGDFHLPVELAALISKREYPARLRGQSEGMASYELRGTVYHTQTYMEEEFSLGSVNVPLFTGEQTASLYATFKLKPETKDFRDAAAMTFKYVLDDAQHGAMDPSPNGAFQSDKITPNLGWMRTMQKDNVVLLSTTPNLNKAPLETEALRLDIVFSAHYGSIKRVIFGDGPVLEGATGESVEVVPVSIEAGEVFIHIQPLLPTSLPRQAALRFVTRNHYEVLQLVNYEGPARSFSEDDLKHVLNGAIVTIEAKKKHASLEEFHRGKSQILLTDYLFSGLRFISFRREDTWMECTNGPSTGTIMTESIDGRLAPHPYFESNQIDVTKLPFVTGPVKPNTPLFPWGDSMEVCWYPDNTWIIGARGLPEEKPYSHRVEDLKK